MGMFKVTRPQVRRADAPLTRMQLDSMTCSNPECTHEGHDALVFHSRCHEATPTWVAFADGILTVTCAECEAVIVRVQVADASSVATQ